MRKIILSVLSIAVFCITFSCTEVYSASLPASSGVPSAPMGSGISTGVLHMNTMMPATYQYPESFKHATTYISDNNQFSNTITPNGNGTNVNVYVGTPVYVMRSGMVRIKHRPRKGRVGTLYPDVDYDSNY